MKILPRYFRSEIFRTTFLVLVFFLMLFSFFDLLNELQSVGKGGYTLRYAILSVLLGVPGYSYELMPIAVLVGTIFALSQFAARSEFTIMRTSSLSTWQADWILFRIGIYFVVLMVIFGELVVPRTAEFSQSLRLMSKGSTLSGEFHSGIWNKDVIRQNGKSGDIVGTRFINIGNIDSSDTLHGLRVYEFDKEMRLEHIILASQAEYQGNQIWRLDNVHQNSFIYHPGNDDVDQVKTEALATRTLTSEITPIILSVTSADPDRMSIITLRDYIRHLTENNQHAERYEIAFWKKVFFPLTVFVMLALALPFAFMHFRSGGVSLKIFCGLMIGVTFQLVDNLFAHVGLLGGWPPLLTAAAPSLIYLFVALVALWWVDRH